MRITSESLYRQYVRAGGYFYVVDDDSPAPKTCRDLRPCDNSRILVGVTGMSKPFPVLELLDKFTVFTLPHEATQHLRTRVSV